MKSYSAKKRHLLALILLAVVICFVSGIPVTASELEVNYTQQIVQDVHYFYLLQIGDTLHLSQDAWVNSAVSIGNLMNSAHSVFGFDLSVYKKLTNYPSYALGVGYKYLYDRKSYFNQQGGKLKEHELTFKLLGTTHFGKTGVLAELSYTPLGAYKFMNESHRPLSAFRFELSAVTPLSEYWNVSFKLMQGSQSYMVNTKSVAAYKLGIEYFFH